MRVYLYTAGRDNDLEVDKIQDLGHLVVHDRVDDADHEREESLSTCDIVVCCCTVIPSYIARWASKCDIEAVLYHEFISRELAGPDSQPEAVSHPPHYTFGKYEVIDVIEDWGLDFHLGNVIKYVARAGRKGDPKEDLLKAKWYLERAIKQMEQSNE
jgi:hypothetical protein